MPWCEECSKYLAPTAMTAEGACPTCEEPVGLIEAHAADLSSSESTPWHFKLLVVATIGYLTWRFLQFFF
jgi:hypothetical protein